MNRLISVGLISLLLAGPIGCGLPATRSSTYVGATADPSTPAVIAGPVTPVPTATPPVLTHDLQEPLFRRDGVLASVTGITYVQNRRIAVDVAIRNQTNQPLIFSARVPGAVNGWAIVFSMDDLEADGSATIGPQTAGALTLTAELGPGAAERMRIADVATLGLSFSGFLGGSAFAPASNIVVNPGCRVESVQPYGDEAFLVHQNERARFYYHGLDAVAAVLYVSAECLEGPFDMAAIPCVNGYSLGADAPRAAFSGNGTRVMLAIPLLKTLQTFAVNAIDTLTLTIVMAQKGKAAGADTFAIPTDKEAVAAANALASAGEFTQGTEAPAAPGYIGSGRTFYQGDSVSIYYESFQTEPSDYYGKITRFRLVCVNDTAAVLCPGAETVQLAGAAMDGGFDGCIPPYSQTRFDFYLCANVNAGAGVYVELQLFDGGARMKRVVSEAISFKP